MAWAVAATAGVGVVGGIASGLMSNESKKSSTERGSTFNTGLDQYTKQFQAMAPWEFASLDPGATLAAMGGTTSLGGKDLGANFKKTLQGLNKEEQDQAKFGQEALQRIRKRQESGQFLTQQETQFINTSLDKAFEYAHKTGLEDFTKAWQQGAGSRGLRMGDTPVAEIAMKELKNFELGIGSQRAQAGINTTMQFSQQQNAFDQDVMQYQQTAAQNKWGTRQQGMFSAMGPMSNINTKTWGNVQGSSTPSDAQRMQSGLQMGSSMMQMAGSMASPWAKTTPSTPDTTPRPGYSDWGTY